MARISKIAAGILLGIGLPISLLASGRLLDPKTVPQDRLESELSLVLVGLPSTIAGGGLLLWGRQRASQQQRDRLQSTFFRLIKESGGHLTVLRFAMETGLEGNLAQQYLNERAREFNATFNVTEEGGVSYYFELGTSALAIAPTMAIETYDVILTGVPVAQRRQVVKVVRDLTGVNWQQAKALVKQLPEPTTLQQKVTKDIAEASRLKLGAVGAAVLIVLR